MKKITLLLSLLLISFMGFQANAELWLIGQLSPNGWVTNKGVQFTDEGEGNYSLDLEVNVTGQQYFSLTTQLSTAADDWDGIRSSRFGGRFEVALDTEVTLVSATDDSPYINFGQTGTYTFNFNINTKVLKVSLKEEIVVPPFTGTIYVTKNSVGNIYAWDADGNYGDWPGTPVSSLETATLDGVDYYTFTYSHASTGPGLIFNEGMDLPQTDDMVPQDGAIYEYLGGTTASIVDPVKPVVPTDLFLVGSFNEWDTATAEQMTLAEDGKYTIEKAFENGAELKFITLQADWEAEGQTAYGAVSEGNFVFDAQYLGQELDITSPGENFQLPAGNYTITVDLTAGKVVFSGEITEQPVVESTLFLVGSFNEWDTATAEQMTLADDGKFTIEKAFENGAELKFITMQADWEAEGQTVYGAVSEGNFVFDAQYLGQELDITSPGENFQLPAGNYTITVDLTAGKVVFSGEITEPVVETGLFLVGTFNGWDPITAEQMTLAEDGKYTIEKTFDTSMELKFVGLQADWDAQGQVVYGAVSEGNFIFDEQYLGQELDITSPGENFQLPAGNYTITVDLTAGKVVFSGEIIKPVVETGMFMVGKFNNWDAANPLALEQQEDGTFVANITFDTDLWNDFKFVTDNSGWETTTVLGADNEGSDYYTVEPELFDWPLNLVSPGANFRVPAGIYTITVAPALREEEEGYTVTISGQTITPETHIYVLGEIDGKTSADWTPYEGLEMATDDYLHFSADITTTNDKNYFNFTKKLATDYDVEDGGWSQIAGYRFGAVADGTEFVVMPDQMGMPLSLGEDCDEPISFMLPAGQWNLQIDLESRTLTITGDYVMPETHVYILGEIDGKTNADWTPYEGLEMTTEDYIHFEANIATTNEINYFNFTKVLATDYDVEDGGWGQLAGNRFGAVTEGGFADPFVVTAEQMGLPLSLSQDCDEPTSFALPAGDWHLSLDLMARTLTITGDFPVPETHVYILGEVNDNGGWFPNVGTEMATDDYITFTANITTAGENWNEELMQGYSYFSFSKALAVNDADNGGWEEIGLMRFGAVVDDEMATSMLVTDDMLGYTLPVTNDGEGTAAFMLPAGEWKLTLNLADRTLIIDKAGLLGDVNGDGEVSIADITMLVDLVSNLNSNERSDVNGDGETSIADVTMLVDLVMGNSGL